jgi:hypothetical protein
VSVAAIVWEMPQVPARTHPIIIAFHCGRPFPSGSRLARISVVGGIGMVVQLDSSFRRVGITTAVTLGLLLGGSWRASSARGQGQIDSTTSKEVKVETWQGNQRAGTKSFGGPAKPPAIVPTAPPVTLLPPSGVLPVPPASDWHPSTPPVAQSSAPPPATLPPLATQALPPEHCSPITEKEKCDLAVVSEKLIRSTRRLAAEWCSAIETCSALMHDDHEPPPASMTIQKSMATTAEDKVPAVAPIVPATASALSTTVNCADAPATPNGNDMLANLSGPLWLQVALVAGVVLFCPLLLALMLALMLRRLGMHLRVEVINSSPGTPIIARLEGYGPLPLGIAGGQGGQPAQPASAEESAPPGAARVEEPETAERFDLGPSYEEERLAKEVALRQQELAVLQLVFEENVRLQEEIEHLDAQDEVEAETDPAPVGPDELDGEE